MVRRRSLSLSDDQWKGIIDRLELAYVAVHDVCRRRLAARGPVDPDTVCEMTTEIMAAVSFTVGVEHFAGDPRAVAREALAWRKAHAANGDGPSVIEGHRDAADAK